MTELQLRAFELIRDRLTDAGYSPTLREIKEVLELPSEASARGLVDALVRSGKLTREPGASRNLALAGEPDLRFAPTSALRAELARRGVSMEALAARPLPANAGRSCTASFCQEKVTPGKLFCRDHWFRIPHWLRQSILEAFAARQASVYQHYVREAVDYLEEAGARRLDEARA